MSNEKNGKYCHCENWMLEIKLNLSELKALLIVQRCTWNGEKKNIKITFTEFLNRGISRPNITKAINSLIKYGLIESTKKGYYSLTGKTNIEEEKIILTEEMKSLIKRVSDFKLELDTIKKAIESLEEVTPEAQKTLDKKEKYYNNLLSELKATGYKEE